MPLISIVKRVAAFLASKVGKDWETRRVGAQN